MDAAIREMPDSFAIRPFLIGHQAEVRNMFIGTFDGIIKAGINMALTLMIYKPISIILHKSGLLEEKSDKEKSEKKSGKFSPVPIIVGFIILATCIGAIILFNLQK